MGLIQVIFRRISWAEHWDIMLQLNGRLRAPTY